MTSREIVFRQLQNDGEKREDLLNNLAVDMASKVLNLRSVLVDHLGLRALVGRDELGDVEDLCVVKDTRTNFLYGVSWNRNKLSCLQRPASI